MKRMKKLFAILMTMAMVMGLGITGFAAEVTNITSDITVRGLSEGVDTTLKVKKAVYLDNTEGIIEWKVAEWAHDYISFNNTTKEVTVTNPQGLYAAAADGTSYTAEGTSYTLDNMTVGAYVIIANDIKATYSPMIANNYDQENTSDINGVKAKNIEVNAKAESYQLTKEIIGGESFVKRGEDVPFKITAIFPAYYNETTKQSLNSFAITDTYKGISIKENSTHITIGDDDVTDQVEITEKSNTQDGTKTDRTFTFDDLLDDETKAYEGQLITITYTATVEDPDTYNNEVNANAPTVNYGPDEVTGWSGNIVITKKDNDNKELTLKGAEFEIYAYKDETNISDTPLQFVTTTEENPDGNTSYYMLAKSGEVGAVSTVVATNGIVKVKGLDDGKYYIKEVKAPNGYSINEAGYTAQITKAEQTVSVDVNFYDTKLSALPSTGGMGTTIFTIAGCVIMISAAGLFFASRRKAN